MYVVEKSLSAMVQKWLSPSPATPIRVTRFGRKRPDRRRYVRVDAMRPNGSVTLFFFRHDDGVWCVFPQDASRLTFCTYANAA